MTRIYVPSSGPDDWKSFLADPEKQWRTGFSARTLAHCWEAAGGLPPEVGRLFGPDAELLLVIPEHKVPLPPRGRESQNDVFALVRAGGGTFAVTIDGKVNEPFGPVVSDWLKEASDGKRQRLSHICGLLGLAEDSVLPLRYQLLHRTASALIEAARFKTDAAGMVVHSFSPERLWFEDFTRFVKALGASVSPDVPAWIVLPNGTRLMTAWASGDQAFLGR